MQYVILKYGLGFKVGCDEWGILRIPIEQKGFEREGGYLEACAVP